MIAFRDRLPELARAPWLQRYWLYRLLYAFALHVDALWDWVVLGMLARYPTHAPPDALPVLGRERGIRRGFAESLDAYAARLLRWLPDRKIKGSPYALMEQLAGYFTGYSVRIRVVNAAGSWYTRLSDGTYEWYSASPSNWDWDGDTASWSRYWIILYVPTALWSPEGLWSNPGTFGDGGVWGSSMAYEQGQAVKAIVRDWNPPHARCEDIIITWDATSFAPTGSGYGYADGTWYRAGREDAGYVLTRPYNRRFMGAA